MKVIKMNEKNEDKEKCIYVMLRESYTDEDGQFHYMFCTKDEKVHDYYKDEKHYIEFVDLEGDKCTVNKQDIMAISK